MEKSLDALEIRVESGPGEIKDRIPEEGPLLIVSNHPFGGVEMLSLEQLLHPEWLKYRKEQGKLDIKTLSACIRGLDAKGKDLPVLVRHYHKIGAKFHCVAVDPNFNNTPGLLLMVDMDNVSKKAISTFLGKDGADYLAYANRKDIRAGSRA